MERLPIEVMPKDSAEIRTKNGDKAVFVIENVTKVTVTGDYTSISYTDKGEQKRVTTNLPFIYNE